MRRGADRWLRGDDPVELVVKRDGRNVPVTITPEYDADAERSLLGVVFGPAAVEPADSTVPEAAEFAVGPDVVHHLGDRLDDRAGSSFPRSASSSPARSAAPAP